MCEKNYSAAEYFVYTNENATSIMNNVHIALVKIACAICGENVRKAEMPFDKNYIKEKSK